jgi:hypothetical protein
MPYENEIIFAAGYGVICISVCVIYIVLVALIVVAANVMNQKIVAFGRLGTSVKEIAVLKRINSRRRFLKTGSGRPVFVRKRKVDDEDDFK